MNASRPDRPTSAAQLSAAHAPVSSHWSLRTRLIVLLLMATSGLWALASYYVYQEAKHDSQELFDDSLQETAHLLLTVVQHELAEHGANYTAQLINSSEMPSTHYLRFQVWNRDGQLVYRSQDAPATPMATLTGVGYTWVSAGADSLRTYVAWNAERNLQIQIGEPLSHRNAVSQRIWWRLVLVAVLFLPLTIFLIWWIISRSFAPIQWISAAVAKRTGHHLDAVDMSNVPREIAPLVQAFNHLLGRIRQTLEYERRFTADAAHELRTPLAAIRAHAQVLQGARNADEAAEAAQDIIAGVDRGTRLVDQLLALARLEKTEAAALPMTSVDLVALVQRQVAAHQAQATQQQITLTAVTAPATTQGNADHLNILLRNLIDNALRYTPSGGEVQVSCGDSQGAYLAVRDSGVGIPSAERQRIFERFYRIAGSQSFGSGLGLSIVQRLVTQHGAHITIEDGLHGTGSGFVVHFTQSI